ncbi:hypothetical protein Glove_431g32 [Diversispora epigaea]|uniref:Uncharacterized protein n=1 Tax=Diversispora epigaea TaxID=1348612 RepID=A0A397GTV3_9GLOM|nr:hypothetical protein Glove_431g32 [Diversispora epigaea]
MIKKVDLYKYQFLFTESKALLALKLKCPNIKMLSNSPINAVVTRIEVAFPLTSTQDWDGYQ